MAETLTMIPSILTVGDTWEWTRSLRDYPASDGWAVSYALVNSDGSIEVTTSASGDDHAVSVAAETTEAYSAGTYKWQEYATKTTERHLVSEGTVTLDPNLAAGTVDTRSHVKKVLDAVESVIEGRASEDAAAMSIAGRSITKMTLEELLSVRDRYRAEYERELRAEKIALGLGTKSTVRVRFTS